MFGDKLNLLWITEVHQDHHRMCLILNMSAQPDGGTRSANDTTYREVTQESMQFGCVPSHSSDNLGGQPGQGPCLGAKYGRDRCLSLQHAQAVPGGSLCLCHPIVSLWLLHHHLHQSGATNEMVGITEVFRRVFRNTYGCGKRTSAHVASSTWIQGHF